MHDLTAKRTLVKSPPELWSEVSEVERLARHLGAFGGIKITKMEPERTVAWEGEGASGTVSIEPSGWGTKVTLTARVEHSARVDEAAAVEPEPVAADPDPPVPALPDPPVPALEPVVEAEPVAEREAEPEPAAEPTKPEPAAEPELFADAPPARKQGFFARLFGWGPTPVSQPNGGEPEAEEPAEPHSEPEPSAAAPQPAAPPPQPRAATPQPAAPPCEPVVPDPPPDPIVREPAPEPIIREPAPEPAAEHAQAVLEETLDALGSAHHRPFSRG